MTKNPKKKPAAKPDTKASGVIAALNPPPQSRPSDAGHASAKAGAKGASAKKGR